MNTERERQTFIESLDKDLSIGKNHLIDDLPARFTAPDFLYFFALRDRFWAHVPDREDRMMSSLAMTECYLSALLDIYSGDYRFNEKTHHLEDCILYGDLLSGAFCQKLIALDRIDVLERWLVLLQGINQELLTYSREGKSTREKKLYLVKQLVAFLAAPEERAEQVAFAQQLLVDGIAADVSVDLIPPLSHELLADISVLESAADLRALKKVNS